MALRAAMETETVKGDLKSAIERCPANRRKGGPGGRMKAMVRMAECYRKLGDAQAQVVYERIVRDYRDQKDAFTLAQSQFCSRPVSRSAATGQTTQVLRAGDVDQVSPDGRYMSLDREGDLALQEVATGNVMPLKIVKPAGIESYPLQSTFSPDGRQLAVEWYTKATIADAVGRQHGRDQTDTAQSSLRQPGCQQHHTVRLVSGSQMDRGSGQASGPHCADRSGEL